MKRIIVTVGLSICILFNNLSLSTVYGAGKRITTEQSTEEETEEWATEFETEEESYEYETEEASEEDSIPIFEIRNGIRLGDDFETVVQKNDLGFEDPDDAKYEEDEDGEYAFYTGKGKIAGVQDASMRFGFRNGKLIDVTYQFPSDKSKDDIDSQYSTFYKSLAKKYGDPLGNTGGSLFLITSKAIENAAVLWYLYSDIFDYGVGDYRDYDEWDYKIGDGYYVKIDLISFYYGTSYSEAEYRNYIGYRLYTFDEYLEEAEKKLDEQKEVDDDL